MTVLLFNLRFGQSMRNYGLIILFALFGASVSVRQILTYIVPGNSGFGPVVLGMHTYTWALLVFMCSILASGIMLVIGVGERDDEIRINPHFIKGLFGIAMVTVLAFTAATFNQCGLDVCPGATEFNQSSKQEQSPTQETSMEELCCPADPKKK